MLTAFVVVGGILWLLKEWLAAGRLRRGEQVACFALAACLALQLVLGVEAWLSIAGEKIIWILSNPMYIR